MGWLTTMRCVANGDNLSNFAFIFNNYYRTMILIVNKFRCSVLSQPCLSNNTVKTYIKSPWLHTCCHAEETAVLAACLMCNK